MAERSPAYSWYPRDWFASVSFNVLPLDAQGAYRNLLDHAWEKDGLPADPRVLQKLSGATDSQWRRIWPLIAHLFKPDPSGRLRSTRQEQERDKQRLRSERGAASANRRWHADDRPISTRPKHRRSDANAMRSHSERNADALPLQSEGNAHASNANGMLPRALSSSSSKDQDTKCVYQDVQGSAPDRPHTHTAQDIETAKALRLLRSGGTQ